MKKMDEDIPTEKLKTIHPFLLCEMIENIVVNRSSKSWHSLDELCDALKESYKYFKKIGEVE